MALKLRSMGVVGHRIVTVAAAGAAAQQPGEREPAAAPETMPGKSLQGVLRAGGSETARRGCKGRDTKLVTLNQQQEWKNGRFFQVFG